MKNLLLLAVFSLIATFGFAQQVIPAPVSPKQLLKPNQKHVAEKTQSASYYLLASRHDTFNKPSSQFIGADSTLYYYNANPTDTMEVTYNFLGATWNYNQKIIRRYTSGQLNETLTQNWVPATSSYRNLNHSLYTYNGNGQETNYLYQTWDTANSAWVNVDQYAYTYDANGRQLSETGQNWNTGTSSWDNGTKYIYAYDANGNQTNYTVQTWTAGAWVNYYQYVYTYNGSNLETSYIYQKWNTGTGQWVNDQKTTFTYDANNNITLYNYVKWDTTNSTFDINYAQYVYNYNAQKKPTLFQYNYWSSTSMQFVPNYKYVYTYDAVTGNQTQQQTFNYNTTTSAFVPSYNNTYTYDANNNNTYELDQRYNTSNTTFENTDQYFNYYELLNSAGINEIRNELNISMFPNPASNHAVTIKFALEQPAQLLMGVYDINGKLVITQAQSFGTGSNNITIEPSELSNGFYTVQLINLTNGKTSVQKLVKE